MSSDQMATVGVALTITFPHASYHGSWTASLPSIPASLLYLLEEIVLILVVAAIVGKLKQI